MKKVGSESLPGDMYIDVCFSSDWYAFIYTHAVSRRNRGKLSQTKAVIFYGYEIKHGVHMRMTDINSIQLTPSQTMKAHHISLNSFDSK